MKFLRVMLAAALCAAALAGCGSSEKGGSAYTTDDVNKIAEAGAFSEELETVDADTAFALYGLADAGLTREQLTDCAVLRSAGATCEEAAVLILDSEDAAQTTMTALDGYIQNQIDTNKDYRCYYMRLCYGLKTLKETLNAIDDGIKIDELTTYWARHSWATVAASLDIPKETIAAALGHGGNTVTDIYIDFDQKKVDEANRKVLDYVFGAPEKKKRGRPKKA